MEKENNEIRFIEGVYYIGNMPIERKIFDEQLIDWISEAKESDKFMVKEDLKYLINMKDKFLFSNIKYNDYIFKSDDKDKFNYIVKEIKKENIKILECEKNEI